MNNLVEIMDNEVVTSSKQVAEVFNKRHDAVLRDIKNIIKNSSPQNCGVLKMFAEDSYVARNGKTNPMYIMNRDGFTLLAMGFTGQKALEFKVKYIEAFNKMEEELKANSDLEKFAKLPFNQQLLVVMGNQQKEIDETKERLTRLENQTYLTHGELKAIAKEVKSRVIKLMREDETIHYYNELSRHYFRSVSNSLLEWFKVPNRQMIRSKDYEEAVGIIRGTHLKHEERKKVMQLLSDIRYEEYLYGQIGKHRPERKK